MDQNELGDFEFADHDKPYMNDDFADDDDDGIIYEENDEQPDDQWFDGSDQAWDKPSLYEEDQRMFFPEHE